MSPRSILISIFIYTFCPFVKAQDCITQAGAIVGSPLVNERGKSLAATPQGDGIYVAGSKDDSTLLMLVDLAGSIVWAKAFDFVPNQEEHIVALIVDSDGMLVLSGIGGDQGNGGSVYAFRYDPINHQILWANDYLTLARNYSFSIIQKGKDGNYIMANNPHTSLNNDSELLELDKNTGAVIPTFSKNYHLGSSETIHDMVYDGNFLYGVGRYTDGPSASDMRNTLMKLDSDNGNQIWVKMGHIPENVSARLYGEDLIIEQGEIYSIYNGDPSGTSTINNKIYVQKTSLNGDLLWVKQYELPGSTDGVWEMIKSGSGIVILAAAKAEPMEFFLFKIDLVGQVMWARSFQFSSIIDGVTGDRGNSVLIEVGDQLVFTGIATNPSGITDLLLVRTDLNGETDLPCVSSESFNIPVGEINNPVFYAVSSEEFSIDPDVTAITTHIVTSDILPREECVIADTVHTTIQAHICEGELFEGYSQSGIYSDTFLLENGCDSIRVLLLTVTPPVVTELNKNICHNESYEGYTISGTYIDTFALSTGCDSIRILHLNVFACAPVIYYDLNACRSYMIDGSHMDYSEFVATYPEFSCAEITAEHVTQIPSPENKHSCTPGVNNTIAMCVGSYGSCTYSAGNTAAVLIDFSVDPHEDSLFRFSGLQFYEKAPATYTWIDGPSGPNNYPRKYGIRILKNGNEIYRNEDIQTSPNWALQTFNFIDNDLFKVEENSVFRIELLPYCPIGNGADVSVWDLDEIRIFSACAAIGDKSFVHGQVTTKSGIPVSNVQMQMDLDLSFDNISTQMTNEEGFYAFADVTSEPCYLKGYKNDDVLNGVSTFDLVLIQKHLLGKTLFTSLHQFIAADADRNGVISVNDLLEIQKVLLGKYSGFQRNTSWRFGALPQDMSGNEISSFQEIKGIDFQNVDTVIADFVGIKIGDVNGDVDVDAVATVIETRNPKDFTLWVDEREIYPGNQFIIHIKSGESAVLAGIQFALDLKGMDLVTVLAGKMPANPSNYSITNEGIFRFSWTANEPIQLVENDVIFSCVLTPMESGFLSTRLELLNELLSPEAYSSDLEILKLKFDIRNDENLSQNNDFFTVEPNPFSSELKIKLNLIEEGNIELNFYDLSGRLLHSINKMYLPGENTLVIPSSQFPGTEGVIYCQLISDGFTAIQKIIKLE